MAWITDRDPDRRVDHSLTALLGLQGLTLFIVIPLAHDWFLGRAMLDVCHLAFAFICVAVLTRHRLLQASLIGLIGLLTAWPYLSRPVITALRLDVVEQHETIALVAFLFNAAVTAVVARHVFGTGRVTAHRVRGAVLVYLNVAALFAIAYGAVQMRAPHAFAGPGVFAIRDGASTTAFTYFSLTTITTTGYGDITPLSPLTHSLANLEAVFGQLFPATLLARLVALHLTHEGRSPPP